MKIVIQCAGRKNRAGTFRTPDGTPVKFVAQPDIAPPDAGVIHAQPDDTSDDGRSWRARLLEYNAGTANPLGFLPAWQLYEPDAYGLLVRKFGPDRVFILSAGWGLIPATFLTPDYDITFSNAPNVETWKRRRKSDEWDDFCLMPDDGEPMLSLCCREYLPLLCRLTATMRGAKTVLFKAAAVPDLPAGFTPVRYETRRNQNWHYGCARDLVAGRLARLPRGG